MDDPFNPPESEGPLTIIGISFDDTYRAHEFLSAASRLHSRGELVLKDAVVVTKDDEGKTQVRETVDLQPGRAALSGAVWTGLLGLLVGGPVGWIAGLGVGAGAGAIAARVVDVGVPDEWVAWFRAAVDRSTFTVVVLATSVHTEAVIAEASRFEGGRLVYANLPPGVIRRIEEALGELADELPADGGQLPPP